ncbi:Fe-S-containing hydro-lyase [Candidatus Margulisiibacteriota bacterium]
MEKAINLPLTDEVIKTLKAGDRIWLSGKIYTARDLAHKKLIETLNEGKKLPVDLEGQVLYYCGPTPPRQGKVIGSAGPTTSSRMDALTEPLLKIGLKGAIGKGARSEDVVKLFKKHKAVYFAAIGGAGALLAQAIKSAKVVAYPELGPEAIYELEVASLPVFVANDINGHDIFKEGVKKFNEK